MLRRIIRRFNIKVNKRRRRNESGQAITEYGAIIAFVSVLVALFIAFAPNSVGPAVSSAFSSLAENMNNMSSTAASYSSS